ncbi:MAG: ribonuclease D [Gammaproteobacteria bacterium]|nr:ribonuclease D [Gammaproteobacteria bacterium]
MDVALYSEVTTADQLAAALAAVATADWLALDTEFQRESTYYPQLCLVQLATSNGSFCIDALVLTDLAVFGEFLNTSLALKIFHAARQDLEALSSAKGTAPLPLFDTQIAAALIGHPDQVSYAWLVEQYCGVTLDKSQTRTDWVRRPLSAEQLAYAMDDVRYLNELRERLQSVLAAEGKLDWLYEETRRLIAATDAGGTPTEAWRRVKGLTNLAPGAIPVACRLAEWRESLAQQLNRPRGWLLKDDALLAIARSGPRDLTALANCAGVPPGLIRRHAGAMLRIIATAAEQSVEVLEPGLRPSLETQKQLNELQNVVAKRARELKVSNTLLATRKDLERVLLGLRPERLRTGWRAEVLAADLAGY